jgi:hypothetical protein
MNRTILRVAGALVTSFLGIGLVAGGLAAFGLVEQLTEDYATRMGGNFALGVVVSGLLLLYAQRIAGLPMRSFAFRWQRRDTFFAALAAVTIGGLSWGYMLLLHHTGAHPLTWVGPEWGMILIALVGHSGVLHEEVLSRGYILAVVAQRWGVGRAILVSALCFALLHVPVRGVSFMVVSWLLGGLLYGYLYVKSGSLLLTLVVHMLHNVVGDLLMYSDNGVSLVHFVTPLSGVEKIVFKLALTLLLLGLIYLVYGRRTGFLQPSSRLVARWAERLDGDHAEVLPLPA